MPECPICHSKLRQRKDGLFECSPPCQFIGDSARVLRTKILKNKAEARLREMNGERESYLKMLCRSLTLKETKRP